MFHSIVEVKQPHPMTEPLKIGGTKGDELGRGAESGLGKVESL